MNESFDITVRISGPRACWTDPKIGGVNKVSLPVPTVPAIEQVIGAVYGKPEMLPVIKRIEVLNPVKRSSIKQNGVVSKKTTHSILQYWTSFLTDVDYRVVFSIFAEDPAKHHAIMMRRLTNGSCYKQPYLGMRDMIATVMLDNGDNKSPIDYTDDFGQQVIRMNYHKDGSATRKYGHYEIKNGVIRPSYW